MVSRFWSAIASGDLDSPEFDSAEMSALQTSHRGHHRVDARSASSQIEEDDVGLFKQMTPEEHAASEAEKARKQASAEQQKAEKHAQRQLELFLASPQGQARTAFEAGDAVFQVDFPVMTQKAEVVAMVGAFNSAKSSDSTRTLNDIVVEGWDLVTASFVFVVQGEESRDKFMSSGQNVAVKGETRGYYVFRRDGSKKKAS